MTKLTRRDFLTLGGVAIGSTIAATTTFLAINDESLELAVDQIQIPIKNLPPAFDGFTIAQMSDIHLYPFTDINLVRRAVEISNHLKPDLVVLTGDYVWRSLEAIFELTPVLADLNAKHGVYSIMGNHDLWTDADTIISAFEKEGLPVLVNQGVPINSGNAFIYLAGLDDGWSGHPSLRAAMESAPDQAPVVLLLHEPDLADTIATDPRISLQLSGHSHGGQVRTSLTGAFILPFLGRKYDIGLYKIEDMWLYTNRGIGMISVPVRYNCPPEITLFTLTLA